MNDSKKFWLSVGLCVSGVALLFTGLFVGEEGVIASSVIASAGSIFILAGAILGIDVVYDRKLTDIFNQFAEIERKKKEQEDKE